MLQWQTSISIFAGEAVNFTSPQRHWPFNLSTEPIISP
ncbi:hypothetical protein CES85_0861 [Ochrobactrum quorumnocens]|uniref:Uncharacterized protein n=1 Tax=Ochrobactrum quorumnocens TaxID=271865 RepID=A0A248UKJ6_9HYPH|nr:hypothetical protein CES85_0861 [[Ochrobactrum] quorumnocens]